MQKIIVLVGPSGCGKTAIVSAFCKKEPAFIRIITDTTRKPRAAEKDGVDYYFVEEFKKEDYLEYTQYSGNYYGTKKNRIDSVYNAGFSPVLIMDSNGIESLKATYPDKVVSVYIHRGKDDIIKALKERNLPPEELERRLKQYDEDIKANGYCDYTVENTKTVEDAAQRLSWVAFQENDWVRSNLDFSATSYSCSEKEYKVCYCPSCSKECKHRDAFRRYPLSTGGLSLCPRLNAL